MKLEVQFINAAQFERSGQLVVVYRSMDQHHPLAPSSTEEGNPHHPLSPFLPRREESPQLPSRRGGRGPGGRPSLPIPCTNEQE